MLPTGDFTLSDTSFLYALDAIVSASVITLDKCLPQQNVCHSCALMGTDCKCKSEQSMSCVQTINAMFRLGRSCLLQSRSSLIRKVLADWLQVSMWQLSF